METMTVIGCPEMLPLDTQHETLASPGSPNVKQLNINIPRGVLGAQSTLVHIGFHLFMYLLYFSSLTIN